MKITTTMRHTIETARERARTLGYGGEYINIKAQAWIGKTDAEIQANDEEFNQNYLRREKYSRAAVIESDPKRKAYLFCPRDKTTKTSKSV